MGDQPLFEPQTADDLEDEDEEEMKRQARLDRAKASLWTRRGHGSHSIKGASRVGVSWGRR